MLTKLDSYIFKSHSSKIEHIFNKSTEDGWCASRWAKPSYLSVTDFDFDANNIDGMFKGTFKENKINMSNSTQEIDIFLFSNKRSTTNSIQIQTA